MLSAALAAAAAWLAWRPAVAHHRRNAQARTRPVGALAGPQVAHLLGLVHIELAGGSLMRSAWHAALAVSESDLLPTVRQAIALDGDIAQALSADGAGTPELRLAAVVARICAATGAAPAEPMNEIVAVARDRVATHRAVTQELSATHASVAVLAGLPLLGLAFGVLLGSDVGWLFATALGRGCLAGGLILEGIGILWLRRMVRTAVR